MEISAICDTCGEAFDVPVWECPECGHHNHEEDDECGNCHGFSMAGYRAGRAAGAVAFIPSNRHYLN